LEEGPAQRRWKICHAFWGANFTLATSSAELTGCFVCWVKQGT